MSTDPLRISTLTATVDQLQLEHDRLALEVQVLCLGLLALTVIAAWLARTELAT